MPMRQCCIHCAITTQSLMECNSSLAGPSTSRRVVNRVQGNTEICTKTGLAGNLAAIAQGTKQQLPWVPYTFLMTAGKSTPPRQVCVTTKEQSSSGGIHMLLKVICKNA